jgi:hypothetical protein
MAPIAHCPIEPAVGPRRDVPHLGAHVQAGINQLRPIVTRHDFGVQLGKERWNEGYESRWIVEGRLRP